MKTPKPTAAPEVPASTKRNADWRIEQKARGFAEVRGCFAHADDHAAIKAAIRALADSLQAQREARQP